MSLHFYAYARKGHEFVDEVARELPTSDIDRAGRMTRCVFRALRNKLSLPDSFKLLTQLPMALKAVYVDGWKHPAELSDATRSTDFLVDVVKEDDRSAWRDFSNEEEVKIAVSAVFRVLASHMVADEYLNVVQVLPAAMRQPLLEKVAVKPTASVGE